MYFYYFPVFNCDKPKKMTPRYSIYAFDWRKDENAFFCNSPHSAFHPIDRKQFYIVNDDTSGFRRFQYIKVVNVDGVAYNQFESEDSIKCLIKIIE
jgi:hypothetical protein